MEWSNSYHGVQHLKLADEKHPSVWETVVEYDIHAMCYIWYTNAASARAHAESKIDRNLFSKGVDK